MWKTFQRSGETGCSRCLALFIWNGRPINKLLYPVFRQDGFWPKAFTGKQRKLTDIGFRKQHSQDLKIKFQDGFFRIKDDTGALSFANQLVTKIYSQLLVYKSNTTASAKFGIYRGYRIIPEEICFFTMSSLEKPDAAFGRHFRPFGPACLAFFIVSLAPLAYLFRDTVHRYTISQAWIPSLLVRVISLLIRVP